MSHQEKKQELIKWLQEMDDQETLSSLYKLKQSMNTSKDWWDEISDSAKASINKGLKDIEEGRIHSHEDVRKRYGL